MKEAARHWMKWSAPAKFGKRRRYIVCSHGSKGVPFTQVERAGFGFAKPGRVRQHRFEYRLKLAGRARNDAQYLGGRGPLLQRLGKVSPRLCEFAGARFELLFQLDQ